MANVKVRKTRAARAAASVNPFPTVEQIVTGVVAGLAQRVIDKALAKIGGPARVAPSHLVARRPGVPGVPATAAPAKSKKKSKSKPKAASPSS